MTIGLLFGIIFCLVIIFHVIYIRICIHKKGMEKIILEQLRHELGMTEVEFEEVKRKYIEFCKNYDKDNK